MKLPFLFSSSLFIYYEMMNCHGFISYHPSIKNNNNKSNKVPIASASASSSLSSHRQFYKRNKNSHHIHNSLLLRMKAVTDPYEQQYQQWASQLSQVQVDEGEVKQVIIDSQELDEQPEQHNNNNNGYNYQNQPSSFARAPKKYSPSYSTPNDVNININFNRYNYNNNINNDKNSNNGDAGYEMQYQQFNQQQKQQNQNININNYNDEQTDQTTTQEQAPVLNDNTQNTPEFNKKKEELTQEQLQEIQDEEERFLQMVSNEISYKKLLGQSPYSFTDLDFATIRQRFLDNLEDSSQKSNGKFKGQSKLSGADMPQEERKTVVVLGTGWGAHAFIKLASTYDLRVVVVSPVNHFVFTPMLASAAVGTVEYRSMTEPIRVTNPYIDNYVEGRAIGLNVEERIVQVQLASLGTVTGAFKGVASNDKDRLEPEPCETQIIYDEEGNIQRDDTQGAGTVIDLSYDYLICAVGTQSRSSMVPGAKEHCEFIIILFLLYECEIVSLHNIMLTHSLAHPIYLSHTLTLFKSIQPQNITRLKKTPYRNR